MATPRVKKSTISENGKDLRDALLKGLNAVYKYMYYFNHSEKESEQLVAMIQAFSDLIALTKGIKIKTNVETLIEKATDWLKLPIESVGDKKAAVELRTALNSTIESISLASVSVSPSSTVPQPSGSGNPLADTHGSDSSGKTMTEAVKAKLDKLEENLKEKKAAFNIAAQTCLDSDEYIKKHDNWMTKLLNFLAKNLHPIFKTGIAKRLDEEREKKPGYEKKAEQAREEMLAAVKELKTEVEKQAKASSGNGAGHVSTPTGGSVPLTEALSTSVLTDKRNSDVACLLAVPVKPSNESEDFTIVIKRIEELNALHAQRLKK